MSRKKVNKSAKQSNATLATPILFAKCTGCQVNGELKACEFCQYPECVACIEKHREAEKLSQNRALLETKIGSLRQQTLLKYQALERSHETTTISLDLLKTTKETFEHTLKAEYDAYEQKLKQSRTITEQHIIDLKRMWTEYEEQTIANAEHSARTDHIMDQIENSQTKKHIQLRFDPNILSSSLGSIDDCSPDLVASNVVDNEEETPNAQVLSLASTPLDMAARFSDVDDPPPSAPFVETNKSESVDNTNDSLEDLKLAPVLLKQQELSKKQKRRQNQKRRLADNANKALTSTEADTNTEPVVQVTTSLDFNRLIMNPRKSVGVVDGQRMASNDEYFLVCPRNKLCLLDSQGKEHWSIKREFKVYDICWSTYSKQFLILSDKDLYSFDLTRKTPLMTEISQFSLDMDECTCYDNIFIVISDYGGPVIEVWDMKMNWKLIKCYKQPISRKQGQGICSIRFSSSGIYLGVTLTEPHIAKAYFQIRNWQDMKVLYTVELPFYDGQCTHYILALPNDEFLVHKFSEKQMFLFDSNGKRKQTIEYGKRICSKALLLNDKNCLAVQTNRPDELHFYDL